MREDLNSFQARNDGCGKDKTGGTLNIGLLEFIEFPSATEIYEER